MSQRSEQQSEKVVGVNKVALEHVRNQIHDSKGQLWFSFGAPRWCGAGIRGSWRLEDEKKRIENELPEGCIKIRASDRVVASAIRPAKGEAKMGETKRPMGKQEDVIGSEAQPMRAALG